jgi:diadenosine tetraphosphatase ApaH/serine/threonine PP2A family protein phosphatase
MGCCFSLAAPYDKRRSSKADFMKAIVSDIHGNLEALQAVLEDIGKHPVEAIYCLGDVIGYGANPRECLDLAMTWPVVLLGNHEEATLIGPENFNPAAARAILWTRAEIEAPLPSQEAGGRLAFLKALPQRHAEGDLLFVHGSPYDPPHEYVFPEDIRNGIKMWTLFTWVTRWCFQGHTHLPGIFTDAQQFFAPEQVGNEYRLGGKAMINVGSVGQPRDGDPRACYVLLDGETVRFRRVPYDIEAAARKIHAVAELDRELGDRLLVGR